MRINILLLLLLGVLSSPVHSQSIRNPDSIFRGNVLKVNLAAFAAENISVQYERTIASRFSLSLGYRKMEKTALPFQKEFSDYLDSPESARQIENLRLGGHAFTPELRFYLSRKGFPKGFYVAPYARWAKYDLELPYQFTTNSSTETLQLDGNLNTFTGGVMVGAQFKIFKFLYGDVWIAGGHYGFASGSLSGSRTLSLEQQDALKSSFDRLKIPFASATHYTVSSEGADIDLDGPWAGVRTGLCLGVRF